VTREQSPTGLGRPDLRLAEFSGFGWGQPLPEAAISWEPMTYSRASPIADAGVVDRNSPRRELLQQLRHGRCSLTITRDDRCPFKVFSELSRANAPSLQSNRRPLPNLYEGPVPGKSRCRLSIRQWAAHNEVIVPMHQNANRVVSCIEPRIGNGAADCEVIDHLLRKPAGISGRSNFHFVHTDLPQARHILLT
jgi:hypothetical protein